MKKGPDGKFESRYPPLSFTGDRPLSQRPAISSVYLQKGGQGCGSGIPTQSPTHGSSNDSRPYRSLPKPVSKPVSNPPRGRGGGLQAGKGVNKAPRQKGLEVAVKENLLNFLLSTSTGHVPLPSSESRSNKPFSAPSDRIHNSSSSSQKRPSAFVTSTPVKGKGKAPHDSDVDQSSRDLNSAAHQMKMTSFFTHNHQEHQDQDRNQELECPERYCGFRNLGNTCYINAAVSILTSLAPFVSDAAAAFARSHCFSELVLHANDPGARSQLNERQVKGDFLLELLRVCKELQADDHGVVNLKALKLAIARWRRIFGGYGQHDCHEFFSAAMELISEELEPRLSRSGSRTSRSDGPSARSDGPPSARSDPGVTDRNFGLTITFYLTCRKCGQQGSQAESSRYISLCLPEHDDDLVDNNIKVTLLDLVHCFLSNTTLPTACPGCSDATRLAEYKITSLPRFLVVHLKRFQIDTRKYREADSSSLFRKSQPTLRKLTSAVPLDMMLDLKECCRGCTVTPPTFEAYPLDLSFLDRCPPPASSEQDEFDHHRESRSPIEISDDDDGADSKSKKCTKAGEEGHQRSTYSESGTRSRSPEPATPCASKRQRLRPADGTEGTDDAAFTDLAGSPLPSPPSLRSSAAEVDDESSLRAGARKGPASATEATDSGSQPPDANYELVAVICHRGCAAGAGHYVSDVRSERWGGWRHYDDSLVTEVPEGPALRRRQEEWMRNGYIAVYAHSSVATLASPCSNGAGRAR